VERGAEEQCDGQCHDHQREHGGDHRETGLVPRISPLVGSSMIPPPLTHMSV
jgi:hypothetical protein